MNKVFNINLGGYPFVIDENAYNHLSNYLKTIHRHFRDSEGYEEITGDIESRMAELFQENNTRPIVTLQMVEEAIDLMGTPEEFGADPIEESASFESESKSDDRTRVFVKGIKTGKRLFRNPDDEVIGGVCSGIAAYFGIQDPLWVRLAFIVIVFGMGFGIPVYLILWAIVPQAESASDRLAMRGEPVNVSNIGKIIEEEIENIAEKLEDLGEDLKDEFDSKKKNFSADTGTSFEGGRKTAGKIRNALSKGIRTVGKAVKVAVGTVLQIWKPIFFIIGMALIIAFAISWIVSIIGIIMGYPFLNYFLPGDSVFGSTIVSANILFAIGIPLVGLILMVMRIFMGTHIQPVWRSGLWVFWFVNIVSLFANATFTAKEFQHGNEISRQKIDDFTNADTLSVEFLENPYEDAWIQFAQDLYINGNELASGEIQLHIEKSKSGQFEVEQVNNARGKTSGMAKELAEKIDYQFDTENNKLILPSHFVIDQGTKWRAQTVNIFIKVPAGKHIVLPKTGYSHSIRHLELDENESHPHYWGHIWEPQTWKMTESGMINPEYLAGLSKEERNSILDNKDFSNIRIEGPVKVFVTQGDEYKVKIDAKNEYRKYIEVVQFGENLDVNFNYETHGHRFHGKPIKVNITLPKLDRLALENTDDTRIKGFKQDVMQLISNTNIGDVKAYFEIDSLNLKTQGRHEIDLRGSGRVLKLSMDERAELDAEHYTVKSADVKAVNRNRIKLAVEESIKKDVSEGSRLTIEGNPLVISQ